MIRRRGNGYQVIVYAGIDPVTGRQRSRAPPAPPTAQEVRELLAAAAAEPDLDLYLRLAATTGLRPGELCALRWVDLDLEAAEVRISGSATSSATRAARPRRQGRRAHDGPTATQAAQVVTEPGQAAATGQPGAAL